MTPEQLVAHKAYERESQRRQAQLPEYRERKYAEKARRMVGRRAEYVALKDRPCTDCGGSFPVECMDFDHLRDKVREVSALVRADVSMDRLRAEAAKCELVCANCHRIRTKMRREAARKI